MSDETLKARPVLIGEHEYARTPRFSWPGDVVIGVGRAARVVPGTWQLEMAPRALVRIGVADALPPATDAVAWHDRLVQIMTLQEPGVQLRVGAATDGTWQTLEVTVPSHPPIVVEFDRAALVSLIGDDRVRLLVRASH